MAHFFCSGYTAFLVLTELSEIMKSQRIVETNERLADKDGNIVCQHGACALSDCGKQRTFSD
jgi:hypothetical protein